MAAPTRRNWRLRSGSARAARSSRLASSAFTLHLLPPEGTLLCRRGIPVPGIEAVVADGSSQSLISRYLEPTCREQVGCNSLPSRGVLGSARLRHAVRVGT